MMPQVMVYNKRTKSIEITKAPGGWIGIRSSDDVETDLAMVIASSLLLYRLCCLFPLAVQKQLLHNTARQDE